MTVRISTAMKAKIVSMLKKVESEMIDSELSCGVIVHWVPFWIEIRMLVSEVRRMGPVTNIGMSCVMVPDPELPSKISAFIVIGVQLQNPPPDVKAQWWMSENNPVPPIQ